MTTYIDTPLGAFPVSTKADEEAARAELRLTDTPHEVYDRDAEGIPVLRAFYVATSERWN